MRHLRIKNSILLVFLFFSTTAHGFERFLFDSTGWSPANAEKIRKYLPAHKNKNSVAIFDWDNTVMKNDIGDAMFFWMVSHNLFFTPTDWKNTSPHLSDKAIEELNRECKSREAKLATNKNQPCADLLLSIYTEGKLTDNKTAAWKQNFDLDLLEPSYAWSVQLMSGYSADEIRKISREVIEFNLQNAEGSKQKIGSKEYPAFVRVYDPIKNLITALKGHQIDVWVCTASLQYLVEEIAERAGFDKSHVVGIRPVLDAKKQITTNIEGCGTAKEGANVITYRLGKRCWINKVIFKITDPKKQMNDRSLTSLAAGDSDTDTFFVKDAHDLHIVINRNKPELMCNALHNLDGNWLVQPMFIDPKPARKEPYDCSGFAMKKISE